MLIPLILIQIVPPMVSVFLYERLRGYKLTDRRRIALFLIFTFSINVITYFVMWIRGWPTLKWTLDSSSSLISVSFVLKCMAISSISAVVIPCLICLVREKTKTIPGDKGLNGNSDHDGEAEDEDEEDFF